MSDKRKAKAGFAGVHEAAQVRRCYIARYTLSASGNDLDEEILLSDTYYSDAIESEWERLVALQEREGKTAPMLQCWYLDKEQVTCMAQTNQPYQLP